MMFFAGFLVLVLTVLIARLALSKETGPALRTFSIIALVCISLAFTGYMAILVFFMFVFFGEAGKDIPFVLIAAVVILAILIRVIVLAIRERRKT